MHVLKPLYLQFHSIFDEAEPEAEADAEGEGEVDEAEEDGEGDAEGLEDVEEDAAEEELDSTTMHGRPTPVSSPGSAEDHRHRQPSYFPELPPLDLSQGSLSSESIIPPPTT